MAPGPIFRDLISAVHARGIRSIIEWVPNHTSWDHVWTREHPDFYVRNEQSEMTVPLDNDGKVTDWTDVADLDYGNRAMRRAMIATSPLMYPYHQPLTVPGNLTRRNLWHTR